MRKTIIETQQGITEMALYLCRMDIENRDKNGNPKLIACLGALIDVPGGYRFNPWNSAHKPSRKTHCDLNKAIPKWAAEKYQGYTQLLSRAELARAQNSQPPQEPPQ